MSSQLLGTLLSSRRVQHKHPWGSHSNQRERKQLIGSKARQSRVDRWVPGARKQIRGGCGGESVGARKAEAWVLKELQKASQADSGPGLPLEELGLLMLMN